MGNKGALRALIWFFVAMAVLSLIARAADTLTIAQVKAGAPKSGALAHTAEAEARVEATREHVVWMEAGLRVVRVEAREGMQVARGDCIAQVDAAQLMSKLEEKQMQLSALENKRQLAQLNGREAVERAGADEKDEQKKQDAIDRAERKLKLELEALDLEIEPAEQAVANLAALSRAGGAVVAPEAGTITHVGLKVGEESGSAAAARIAGADSALRAVLKLSSAQVKYVAVDDGVQVTKAGKQNPEEARVMSVAPPDADDQCTVQVGLSGSNHLVGSTVSVKFFKKTDSYRACVPLSALRSESSGDFVLVLREQSGVLGVTQAALKIPVRVLDRDDQRAAVEGALMEGELVIEESDKAIGDGDRVRRIVT